MLTVATTGAALWPSAQWPRIALGCAAGLPHAPLLVGILAAVPPRQRLFAMLIHHAAAGTAAFILTAAIVFLPPVGRFWALAAIALVATVVFTRLLFRPFIEQLNEIVFRPLWYPVAYGPGATGLPTRGPVLIIGNHSAMFDPVWIAGVVPAEVAGHDAQHVHGQAVPGLAHRHGISCNRVSSKGQVPPQYPGN